MRINRALSSLSSTLWLKLYDVNKAWKQVTSADMRYLRKCREKTRRDSIRWILNQEPFTKMVDKGELRLFWHLIRMDSNSKPRQVWERTEGLRGKRRPRIQLQEHMGMLAWKKGKNLQEVTRLAKERKAFLT